MLLAEIFCFVLGLSRVLDCLLTVMVLLLSGWSKYSEMNFSKAAISSRAAWLISDFAAEVRLQSLRLLELLDLREDWLL